MNCEVCNQDHKNATGYVLVRPYGSSTIMFYAVRCPKGCDHGQALGEPICKKPTIRLVYDPDVENGGTKCGLFSPHGQIMRV